MYWQCSYLPPAASTFAPSGSNQPTHPDSSSHVQPLAAKKQQQQQQQARQPKQQQGAAQSKAPSKQPSPAQSPPHDQDDQHQHQSNLRRDSDEISVGNSTLHQQPSKLAAAGQPPPKRAQTPASSLPAIAAAAAAAAAHLQQTQTLSDNPHYDDTTFGDEPARTYSPTELDSLRHMYQSNVNENANGEGAGDEDEYGDDGYDAAADNIPSRAPFKKEARSQHDLKQDGEEEEEEGYDGEEGDRAFEEAVDEEIEDEALYGGDEEEEDPTEVTAITNGVGGAGGNFRNYQATSKSEDDVVVGDSWDPNNTRRLPKSGNEDNVIIEISSFMLKETSQVLKRSDIQQLFVGMEFLNYDPVELEAANSMPKPAANQLVHFNFRKIFPVDAENNMDKREQLAHMLDDPNKSMYAKLCAPCIRKQTTKE